jgi:hypothetical protein
MLLQIQDSQRGLTIKEGVRRMAAEGACRELLLAAVAVPLVAAAESCTKGLNFGAIWHDPSCCPGAPRDNVARVCCASSATGTVRAFFKGNGTNVVKIAPETAIKLTMNDVLKQVRRWDLLPLCCCS